MIFVLNNSDKHEVVVKKHRGRFMAYIEVLGFHAYGLTEQDALKNLIEISKPWIKNIEP